MRILFAIGLLACFFGASAMAIERVDLATPDQARPGTSIYRVAQISFDWERTRVAIMLVGANGERKEVVYGQNTGAQTLLRDLNRPGNQTKSLHRRFMEKLIADGHLVGSISGQPD